MAPAPPPVPRTTPNQYQNESNGSNFQTSPPRISISQSQLETPTSTAHQIVIAGPNLSTVQDDQSKQSNIFPKLSSSHSFFFFF